MFSRGRKKHVGSKTDSSGSKKKQKVGSSSSNHDRTKFTHKEREERYQKLLNWKIIPERRIELKENDYPEFQDRVTQRQWWTLALPPHKYDPEVVREFYANAYPLEESGELGYRSWVRGRPIDYSRQTINQYLGSPYTRDQECTYYRLKAAPPTKSFYSDHTAEGLCIRGRSYDTTSDGTPRRIFRKDMTTLAQTWMMFMLHNITPNSHVSSLPIDECHLLRILFEDRCTVDIARVITEFIYKTATKGGAKETLGLPALITALCENQGVRVQYTEPIKPPINKTYIDKYCKEDTPQRRQAPPPPQPRHLPQPPRLSIDEQLARMSLHMEHIELQNDMLRQGQLHQQTAFYQTAEFYTPGQQFWFSPDQFAATYPWPGVRPIFPGEEGAAGPSEAAGDADTEGDQEDDDDAGDGAEDQDQREGGAEEEEDDEE